MVNELWLTVWFSCDQTDYPEPHIAYLDTIEMHNTDKPTSIKLEDNGVYTLQNGSRLEHRMIVDELRDHAIKHTQKYNFVKVGVLILV